MKEWFKARNIWGAAIESLSDEEAGKFVKALWAFTMNGEKTELTGSAAGVFAIAVMQLSMDDEQAEELSKKRAEAGASGGKKRAENQANQANASFATDDEANQANAYNKNKNKSKNIDIEKEKDKEKDKGRFTPPTLEDVKAYCQERRNNVNPVKWYDFYTSNGWKVGKNPMKDWKAAVRTWESERDYGNNTRSYGNATEANRADYSFLPSYDVV